MKHKKVRFLTDHQSPYSGNEFYKRGTTATFRDSAADILVDGGHAEYTDKPTTEKRQPKAEPAPMPLTAVSGVGGELAVELNERGILTATDLANATVEALTPISGIGKKRAQNLINAARQSLSTISVVNT